MVSMLATKREQERVAAVHTLVEAISNRVKGTKVIINKGKYAGRIAELDGAMIWWKGDVTYLCYVLRKDGTALNTDGESRCYRPVTDFEVV